MTTRSAVVLVAKIALPVLIALLWAYRRYLAQRPTPLRKDEITFERQYERLEPRSSQPDYVRGAGDLLLRYHEWGWFALLLAAIAIGILAVKEPLVRIIFCVTGIVLGTIVVAWICRQRSVAKRSGLADEHTSEAGSGTRPNNSMQRAALRAGADAER